MSREPSSVSPLCPGDLAADSEIAAVASSYRFLLAVSPVNLDSARRAFTAGEPVEFEYRPRPEGLDELRDRLNTVDISACENSIVQTLLQQRVREIELELDMLDARDTPDFLKLSLERFGGVSPRLLDEAVDLLENIDNPAPSKGRVNAEEFAAEVVDEIERYRQDDPDFDVEISIDPEVGSLTVSEGAIHIPAATSIPRNRVKALIQHEIGTHVLSYVNGSRQPVRLLAAGLAGYEETQEGLAVFTEYLVGGLTARRMRTLAARVVAVDSLVGGAKLPECHETLSGFGLSSHSAFGITARVYRSGGLTKDALYLQGLLNVIEYVRSGGSLERLWVGKVSLDSFSLVEDLLDARILRAPALVPRLLETPESKARIDRCSTEFRLRELVQ